LQTTHLLSLTTATAVAIATAAVIDIVYNEHNSIGFVVALSAFMMGGQSLYFYAFPRTDAVHSSFCEAGE
jgi:hypothetical protein